MIEQEIVDVMTERGYKWRINGELVTPTVDDVVTFLEKSREVLFAEDSSEDATIIMTTGRLILKRDGKHMDVYIHLGDANDYSSSDRG